MRLVRLGTPRQLGLRQPGRLAQRADQGRGIQHGALRRGQRLGPLPPAEESFGVECPRRCLGP